MKFFEVQRKSKRNTIILGVFFAITVIIISALNAFLISIVIDPKYLIKAFVASCLMFIFIYLWKYFSFNSGSQIALNLGGTPLVHPIQDAKERQLYNVVEEISIAASLPVPMVFILKKDLTINAFATGLTPQQAVIGITQGCLEHLTRDELQAIVGHEFSHILNEDLSLNIQTAGVVSGFMFMMEIGKTMLHRSSSFKSRRRSTNGYLPGLGVAFLALGALGFFMGRLIQSAISREREYLADASSAQFTRNPESLATALKKISTIGSKINSPSTYGLAHIFFSATEKSWFDTHPPIHKRIESLGFDINRIEIEELNLAQMIEAMPIIKKVERRNSHPHLQNTKTQLIMPILQAENLLNEIRSQKIYTSLQDPACAKDILMAILISEQTPELQQQSLAHTPEQSLPLIQDLLSQIKNNSFFKIIVLQLALGFIKTRDAEYRQETLKYVYEYFRVDNQWTLAESLIYIYASTTLNTEVKSASPTWNLNSYLSLESLLGQKTLSDPKNLLIEVQKIFSLSFKQKSQVLHNVFESLNKNNERSELYLLCLILSVPAPIKSWGRSLQN